MKPPGPDAAGAERAQPGSSRRGPQRSKSATEVPGRRRDERERRAREGSPAAGKSPTAAAGRAPIVGVVLAGGKGSRLGRGKAGLRLPGSAPGRPGPTLAEWAAARLAAVDRVREIVLAAGDAGVETGSIDCRVPVSVEADGPGSGPAAGLLGAARARPGRKLLVLACDLPAVPVELLGDLAASGAELAAAATDPADPRAMNPTCALWTPPAIERLAARVARDDYRLYPLTRCDELQVEPVDARRFGAPEDVLLNVNTAADWERARRLVNRSRPLAGAY